MTSELQSLSKEVHWMAIYTDVAILWTKGKNSSTVFCLDTEGRGVYFVSLIMDRLEPVTLCCCAGSDLYGFQFIS